MNLRKIERLNDNFQIIYRVNQGKKQPQSLRIKPSIYTKKQDHGRRTVQEN
jgi:hypothetical protein